MSVVQPAATGTDEPTVAGTDESTVVGTDQPTVVGTDESTVASTDEPTVAGTDQPTSTSADQSGVRGLEQPVLPTSVLPAPTSTDQLETSWTVVVPVKVTSQAKTRLAGDLSAAQRVELVRAMVVDTVAAARATPTVDRVVVVTDDPDVVADLGAGDPAATSADHRVTASAAHPAATRDERRADLGVQRPDGRAHLDVVPEPSPAAGLNAAIRAGVASARSGGRLAEVSVAVLLGDLPALRPGDLGVALGAASEHARAVVTDADGAGTTLLTARCGVEVHPAFGPGSASEHAARGHVVLDVAAVPALSGLRQDVDLAQDLSAVAALGPGPRTAEVLDRWARLGDGFSAA